ncbi:hypothetical protein [Gordonia sp. NPDC058843]|uniref:hypothetical protein n=1 Tax=Gordonia sp. NPDC058843 TaxID=3346648 RepID=UPI00369CAC92
MTLFPTDRYGLIRREAALRVGITDDTVAAAVRRGDLIRLAPGIWVEADDSSAADPDGVYRLRCIAVAGSVRDRGKSTLSHDSAAALHGLQILHPERETVHFTKRTKGGGFVRGHRHVHVGPLLSDDVTVVDGIEVTSLARTAVDVATAGDFERALVVFDRALTMGADRELMSGMLATRARWPGIAAARRALDNADRLSESVGESWSRAQMIAAGLPAPRLQHTFRTSDGEVRADFDWEGRLIGEFDGIQKYGLRPGETPREALIREKRREDALRAQGLMVVRWTWGMLERAELVDHLRPWLEKLDRTAA